MRRRIAAVLEALCDLVDGLPAPVYRFVPARLRTCYLADLAARVRGDGT